MFEAGQLWETRSGELARILRTDGYTPGKPITAVVPSIGILTFDLVGSYSGCVRDTEFDLMVPHPIQVRPPSR